jgi:hypothetical protein
MELNELILLAAASLRASYEYGSPRRTIEESVKEAKLLWLEVLKQDNPGE